ncbi:hypothetical protein [Stieleria mannarensis]|uniref:hypothetical protein n=1 Tax=Stieleria mannarensis TaxID=2755585 RepID=UPI001602A9B7|nr:hypothetical protein [Rhodopirellula sp. JC639]
MKRRPLLTLLLLAFAAMTAPAAEPIRRLESVGTKVPTVESKLPPAPTLEQKVAALTELVAQQQSQIETLRQQLTDQANAIEMLTSDTEAVSDRVAAFEQVFTFSDATLSINFEAIAISTDALAIDAGIVQVDSDLKLFGKLQADEIETDYIDAESYDPGAGNIW